ncbi:Uncharacterized protein dnl_34560 [Desulfonema limicola]|uniref:FAD-dependent protein C-terminal domain-containing protein n=1 Tax=Desulfonema limicola TaxID=45656 RepID=A0A975B9B7_9BACT|nr:hypothetical protein [Desulfonema limicola]QTA81128.1 Uncharacterized protein dnl_34560 [Desulfonema limicola]
MGYKEIILKLPTDYTEQQLEKAIEKALMIKKFSYQTARKSLDARKKGNIHWQVMVSIFSEEIKSPPPAIQPLLEIPYKKRKEKALVAGSGPAGFFAALVLQKSGFQTTLIERGADVKTRAAGILAFEKSGVFNPAANYAFGEGGAGTFSDGKLTSRSKHISREKSFILSSYVNAGAPQEIQYMAHPHLGTDNLRLIVKNLRKEFQNTGGTIMFETFLKDLKIKNKKVIQAVTNKGDIEADIFILAPGHSAYETFRMLIARGICFRTKNFAIGSRVEHPQALINKSQWGQEHLPGVKAAEYRLTFNKSSLKVYTFCMCPGGFVVPAAAYADANIVNGMSRYQRDAEFANAACVAGVHPDMLLGRKASVSEAIDWLENLEQRFYKFAKGFKAPFCSIKNFIDKKEPSQMPDSSYPLGLAPAPLWELLPSGVSNSMGLALKDFSTRIKGFETGSIMGLESKTSSPIQVIREKDGTCSGFENLYLAGEGSGYSGGIISSGADGIKTAMNIAAAS